MSQNQQLLFFNEKEPLNCELQYQEELKMNQQYQEKFRVSIRKIQLNQKWNEKRMKFFKPIQENISQENFPQHQLAINQIEFILNQQKIEEVQSQELINLFWNLNKQINTNKNAILNLFLIENNSELTLERLSFLRTAFICLLDRGRKDQNNSTCYKDLEEVTEFIQRLVFLSETQDEAKFEQIGIEDVLADLLELHVEEATINVNDFKIEFKLQALYILGNLSLNPIFQLKFFNSNMIDYLSTSNYENPSNELINLLVWMLNKLTDFSEIQFTLSDQKMFNILQILENVLPNQKAFDQLQPPEFKRTIIFSMFQILMNCFQLLTSQQIQTVISNKWELLILMHCYPFYQYNDEEFLIQFGRYLRELMYSYNEELLSGIEAFSLVQQLILSQNNKVKAQGFSALQAFLNQNPNQDLTNFINNKLNTIISYSSLFNFANLDQKQYSEKALDILCIIICYCSENSIQDIITESNGTLYQLICTHCELDKSKLFLIKLLQVIDRILSLGLKNNSKQEKNQNLYLIKFENENLKQILENLLQSTDGGIFQQSNFILSRFFDKTE